MYKTVIRIDGMLCGMCEAHICDCVRRTLAVKRVTASHTRGSCTLLTETPPDTVALQNAIAATGYTVQELVTLPMEQKHSLFSRLRRK